MGVIGVGYVGLVTAACFADLGHEVVCRDIDAARVEALQSGDAPIYEPGIDRLLERNRGRMTFTLDMADVFARCRVVFVCVDTPQMQSGDADLSRVNRVLDELPALDERVVLVMKSTVPVGTAARLQPELEARGLGHVGYVSNPEFLREGRAIADFMEPDRIVIGSFEPADGDRVAALYADLDAPVVRTDPASSEMSKYASNAFLATKISFINEIANVCEQVDADVTVVAHAMGLDERIGTHFLRPGIGYGGSCLIGRRDGAGGRRRCDPRGLAPAPVRVARRRGQRDRADRPVGALVEPRLRPARVPARVDAHPAAVHGRGGDHHLRRWAAGNGYRRPPVPGAWRTEIPSRWSSPPRRSRSAIACRWWWRATCPRSIPCGR